VPPVDDPDVVDPPDFDEPDGFEPDSDDVDVSAVEPDELVAPASAGFDSDDEERFVALRSFFAQPEPLKWIAGAANALRTFVE
jgi:hypothetical protein